MFHIFSEGLSLRFLFFSGSLVLHKNGKHSPWNIRMAFTGSTKVGQHASVAREIETLLIFESQNCQMNMRQ